VALRHREWLLSVVVVLSLIRGISLVELVPLMLVLLMSAVPVALPVMFTLSMALGSKELAKHGVLVTRLSATEDAATMDVLCVDKTGTITMNRLAVTDVIPLDGAKNPMCYSRGHWRLRKQTRIRSTRPSSQRPRNRRFSITYRRSRPFLSHHSKQKNRAHQKPWVEQNGTNVSSA